MAQALSRRSWPEAPISQATVGFALRIQRQEPDREARAYLAR